ncbi:MT-A70 family methyltransferase [Roseibacillus persicicus]|uniref:MT-A70 family methyltransferase n=1 Tax=Roseibacillus persicicus TaxID=454148 RepID=UPI00398B3CA1
MTDFWSQDPTVWSCEIIRKKYRVIYADPPWRFRDKMHPGWKGVCHKYSTLRAKEIAALPVGELTAENCLLAMWWVPSQPEEALQVMKAWGFRLATMKGFTWVKRTRNGKRAFGLGHYTRGNTECCLFGVKGKTGELVVDRGISQLVEAPLREHSRKPDEVRENLELLTGAGNRIELFARSRHQGWDAWGNQAPAKEAA